MLNTIDDVYEGSFCFDSVFKLYNTKFKERFLGRTIILFNKIKYIRSDSFQKFESTSKET